MYLLPLALGAIGFALMGAGFFLSRL
jgi:hypothetical protein